MNVNATIPTLVSTGPILFVEDDHDIRESVLEALQDEGYAVVGATDGLDALERLRGDESVPRLILLDLMMPRMSGPELHRELTKVSRWAAIPVVVVTADGNAREKAESLGAAAYLRKPFTRSQLFDVVAKVLGA